jgi:hypothetical protein
MDLLLRNDACRDYGKVFVLGVCYANARFIVNLRI